MRGSAEGEARVGAVVVHYQALTELGDCLRSLCAGTKAPDELVIVDNSEDPLSIAGAARLAVEFGAELVASENNIGFAAGCNRGVAMLHRCDQIFLINQDAVVGPTALVTLSRTLHGDDHLGAVNPLITTGTQRVWFAGGNLNRRLARLSRRSFGGSPAAISSAETEWLNGCALLIRSEAWDQVGGFDERYFLYWEDVEFSLRLTEAGWGLAVDPSAEVVHHQDRDGDRDEMRHLSPVAVQHSIRSRLLFVRHALTPAERLTAAPYTVINVMRFVYLIVRARGLRVAPFVTAITAGLRGGITG